MIKKKIFIFGYIFLIFGFTAFFYIEKLSIGQENLGKVVTIQNGDGILKFSYRLRQSGIIKNEISIKIYCYLLYKLRIVNDLKYGEYLIDSTSIFNLLKKIENEQVLTYKVSFPEGITTFEFIKIINSNNLLEGDSLLEFKQEGYLMPETYIFVRGTKKIDILKAANQNMINFLESIKDKLKKDKLIKNEQELLTLASIIEKETAISEERATISSVYRNRLKINMRLQADPTTIYAITKGRSNFLRGITKKDLLSKDKYNTYTNFGLPPGPIGNPSKESILAALNPANTNYLYFVAKGDGSHIFSTNYEDHKANVEKYILFLRSQKQKNENKN